MTLYRPSLRAWLAILVLLGWAGSLTWLGVRRLGRSEANTLRDEASLRLGPSAAWFALYSGDVQVGTAGITLDTLSPSGFKVQETFSLETPGDSGLVRTATQTVSRLTAALTLTELTTSSSRASTRSRSRTIPAPGRVGGRVEIGETAAGGSAPVGEDPLSWGAFPLRLALTGGLAEGRERVIEVLDGWPTTSRRQRLTVGSDSLIVFGDSAAVDAATGRLRVVRYDSTVAHGVLVEGSTFPYRLWIDRRGAVGGLVSLFGIRWVRADFDMAMGDFRTRLRTETARIRGAYPRLEPLATSPFAADSVTVPRRFRLQHRDGTPIDRDLAALLTGGRQRTAGDVLHVEAVANGSGADRRTNAGADPLIQESAPAIQAEARKIFGNALGGQPSSTAALIAAVRRLVTLDTAATAPLDALGALQAKRAQPDGMARLFVAMARAGGMSARMVVGVFPRDGVLYTHAWAEIWTASPNGWMAVDPVNGRAVAPTGLIRFALGGSSRPEHLLPWLANAAIVELDGTEGR